MGRTGKSVGLACWIGAVLAVVVGVVVYFGNSVETANLRREVEAQRAQLQSVRAEVDGDEADVRARQWAVASEVTGVDVARVEADSAAIRAFAERVTTWSSQAEYDEIRDAVMAEHGLTDSDQFVKVFLPRYVIAVDSSGNRYSPIDMKHANCHYVSADVILSGIAGDKYSYFTVVTATGSRDGASAKFDVVMMCTVDGSGGFSNITGYTLS